MDIAIGIKHRHSGIRRGVNDAREGGDIHLIRQARVRGQQAGGGSAVHKNIGRVVELNGRQVSRRAGEGFRARFVIRRHLHEVHRMVVNA